MYYKQTCDGDITVACESSEESSSDVATATATIIAAPAKQNTMSRDISVVLQLAIYLF